MDQGRAMSKRLATARQHSPVFPFLPIRYQTFLWEQAKCFQRLKQDATASNLSKAELACSSLAGLIREGKSHAELDLGDISEKDLIEAALPYVALGCSAVLPRRPLGNRLSPGAIKLLSTLHWILVESHQMTTTSFSRFHFYAVDAFVRDIIPCVDWIYPESDLVGNLRMGAGPLWERLKQNLAPDVPQLTYEYQCADFAPSSPGSGIGTEKVSVFDIAVVRSLAAENWSDEAMLWGLKYLRKKITARKLQSVDEDNDNRSSRRRDVDFKSLPTFSSLDRRFEGLQSEKHIDLSYYLSMDSRLNISSVFDALASCLRNSASRTTLKASVLEAMLCLVNVCLKEIFEGDAKVVGPLQRSVSSTEGKETFFEKSLALVFHFSRRLGCAEGGCTYGIKGKLGQQLHAIRWECLAILARYDPAAFKKQVQAFLVLIPIPEVMITLHRLYCYCCIGYDMFIRVCVNAMAGKSSSQETVEASTEDLRRIGLSQLNVTVATNGKDVETFFTEAIIKTLVERLTGEDLTSQPNMYISHQVCLLMEYLNVHHESLLRRVAFSALIGSRLAKRERGTSVFDAAVNGYDDDDDDDTCSLNEVNSTPNHQSSFPPKVIPPKKKRFLPHFRRSTTGKVPSMASSQVGSKDLSQQRSTSRKKLQRTVSFGEVDLLRGIDLPAMRYNVQQFALLLSCTELGTLPSPNALAATLEINAPVLSRVALLFECALLVQQCRAGNWPVWMLANSMKSIGLAVSIWHWGVAIGNKLEEIMKKEERFPTVKQFGHSLGDYCPLPTPSDDQGDDETCPFALKMFACQLLLEITAFLRECPRPITRHQIKSSKISGSSSSGRRPSSRFSARTASSRSNRHRSSVVQIIPEEAPSPTTTHRNHYGVKEAVEKPAVMFVSLMLAPPTPPVYHTGNHTSRQGSVTSLPQGVGLSPPGRQSSRSDDAKVVYRSKRSSVAQAARRSFLALDQSISVAPQDSDSSGDDLENDGGEDFFASAQESLKMKERRNFPWMGVVAKLVKETNVVCSHEPDCVSSCKRRQKKRCLLMLEAIEQIYSNTKKPNNYKKLTEEITTSGSVFSNSLVGSQFDPELLTAGDGGHDLGGGEGRGLGLAVSYDRKTSRNPSISSGSKTGNQLLHLMRVAVSMGGDGQTGAPHRSRSRESVSEEEGVQAQREKTFNEIRIKYLKEQVQGLSHAAMSALIVAAPVLPDSVFHSVLDAAWTHILDPDIQVASASACLFLLASARLSKVAEEKVTEALDSADPLVRIEGICRFSRLWKNRYQVWPRMERDAQKRFKVPPLSIGFTLPSPPLGRGVVKTVDSPWEITRQTSEENEEDTSEKLLQEKKEKEEERKKKARRQKQKVRFREIHCIDQAATDTAASIGADNDADMPDVDRRRYSLFPSAVYSAIPLLITLLDDASVGQSNCMTVGESAQQIVWDCLVEEPALFFRPLQEKAIKLKEQSLILQTVRRLFLFFPSLPPAASQFIYNHMIGMIMYYANDAKAKPKEGSQDIILDLLSILWQAVPSVRGLNVKQLKDRLKKERCDRTVIVNSKPNITKELKISSPTAMNVRKLSVCNDDDITFESVLVAGAEYFKLKRKDFYLQDAQSGRVIVLNHYVGDHYFHDRRDPKESIPHLKLLPYNDQEPEIQERIQKTALMHTVGELCRVLHGEALLRNVAGADSSMIPKGMTPEDFLVQHVEILHGDLSRQRSFPRRALESNFELYKGVSGKELVGADLLHKQVWVEFVLTLFQHMPASFSWGDEAVLFLHVINGAMLLHCEDRFMLRLCLFTLLTAVRKFTNLFPVQGYKHVIPTLLQTYSSHSSYDYVLKGLEYFLKECYTLHKNRFLLELLSASAPLIVTERIPYFSHKKKEITVHKLLPVHLFSILKSLEQVKIEDVLSLEEMVNRNGQEDASAAARSNAQSTVGTIQEPETPTPEANFHVLDGVKLMVSVVVNGPEKLRGSQMLYLLECLMPFLLNDLDRRLPELARCIQILIKGCHVLKENYPYHGIVVATFGNSSFFRTSKSPFSTPHSSGFIAGHLLTGTARQPSAASEAAGGGSNRTRSLDANTLLSDRNSFRNFRRGRPTLSRHENDVDASAGVEQTDGSATMGKKWDADRQKELMNRMEFRESRDSLLSLTAEFICTGLKKITDYKRCDPSDPILLGSACHATLSSVANSLLKLAPYDPGTMSCEGLRRYMLEFLPGTAEVIYAAGFTDPGYQGAMYRIITRLYKIFHKLDFSTPLDWNSLALLLKGPYLVLQRARALARLESFRELVETVLRIVNRHRSNLAPTTPAEALSATAVAVAAPHGFQQISGQHQEPPPFFCESVVRLVTMMMVSVKDEYSLERVCGNPAMFGSTDSNPVRILRTLLLPLCIRLGCGRSDWPKASARDIRYTVTCLLHTLLAGSKWNMSVAMQREKRLARFASFRRQSGTLPTSSAASHRPASVLTEKTADIVFHGLKIVTICFEKELTSQLWNRIAKSIKQYSKTSSATESEEAIAFWNFLDFLARERGPLFIQLKSFMREKASGFLSDETKKYVADYAKKSDIARSVLRKLNPNVAQARCRAALLQKLAQKLAVINDVKAPAWDADTPDVVSIAALQSPPKSRRHLKSAPASAQVPANISEEEIEIECPTPPSVSHQISESVDDWFDGDDQADADVAVPDETVVTIHNNSRPRTRSTTSSLRRPVVLGILNEQEEEDDSEAPKEDNHVANGVTRSKHAELVRQRSFDIGSPPAAASGDDASSPSRNVRAIRVSVSVVESRSFDEETYV